MSKPLGRIRAGLQRFRQDRRGVSAVEFALVAPLLILIFLGINELCKAMMVQRKVSHAASAIGDLVAQAPTMDKDQIDQIFAAGTATVVPFDSSLLNLRLTSITVDENNVAKVDWSRGKGMSALSKPESNFPAGIATIKGESVIFAETSYTYSSPIQFEILGFKPITGLQLGEQFYLRPRGTKIPCSDCDPVS
jgi:Flp pilus assembly protein TadG